MNISNNPWRIIHNLGCGVALFALSTTIVSCGFNGDNLDLSDLTTSSTTTSTSSSGSGGAASNSATAGTFKVTASEVSDPITAATGVKISWSSADLPSQATGVVVYRKLTTDTSYGAPLTSLPATKTDVSDVPPTTATYLYLAVATTSSSTDPAPEVRYQKTGTSDASAGSVSVTGVVTTPSASGSVYSVVVAWNAVTGATGYDIERSVAGANTFASIGSTTAGVTTYTDTTGVAGTSYDYKVVSAGNVQTSGVATIAVPATAPNKITGIQGGSVPTITLAPVVTATASGGNINVGSAAAPAGTTPATYTLTISTSSGVGSGSVIVQSVIPASTGGGISGIYFFEWCAWRNLCLVPFGHSFQWNHSSQQRMDRFGDFSWHCSRQGRDARCDYCDWV